MSEFEKLRKIVELSKSPDATIDMLRVISESIEDVQFIGIAEQFDEELYRISHVSGCHISEQLKGSEFSIGEGFLGQVLATGQPGFWSNVTQDPRYLFFSQKGVNPVSIFCFPFLRRTDVFCLLFGGLSAGAKEETRDLLEILSVMVGSSQLIDSLEENLNIRTIRLSSIVEMSKAITTVQDVKNILYILLDMSLNLVKGSFTCIAYKRPNDSGVEVISRGIPRQKAAEYGRMLAVTYMGEKVKNPNDHKLPRVRKFGDDTTMEFQLLFRDEVVAVLAVAVDEEKNVEEFIQLISVLSIIGNSAMQRILSEQSDGFIEKGIELIHRFSAHWDQGIYHRTSEMQQLVFDFVGNLGWDDISAKIIQLAAALSPYEVQMVTDLLPGLDQDVIQVLKEYRIVTKSSLTDSPTCSSGGQILALADYHLGNRDVNLEVIDDDLRENFRNFVLQKDIESQTVFLNDLEISELTGTGQQSELSVFEELTGREMEVLKLLANGMGNKKIAQSLFISEHTVKNHLTNIFQKLGVKDRTQAVALVYQYLRETN